MEDYELGKLAEELIQSRYGKLLSEKDDKIKNLEKNITDLKESKTYCKINTILKVPIYKFGSRFEYQDSEINIEYKNLDQISDELNEKTEHIEELNGKIDVLSNVNIKLDRFIHRNKLSSFVYKLWCKKETK